MLDAFALVIPLFAVALWAATERKTSKDVDFDLENNKPAKHVQINVPEEPESPTPASDEPTSLSIQLLFSNSIFSRCMRTQDDTLILLAPLNLLTCLSFLALFMVRLAGREYIPPTVQTLISFLYSVVVCASVQALRTSNRHSESSFVVAVMSTLRALEYLTPVLLPEGYELIITQSVLDTWGNFLGIYILGVLVAEFSSEDKSKEAYIDEAFSQGGNAAEPPAARFPFTRDNIIIGCLLFFSLVTSMLVVVPDWHHKLSVMIGFESSICITLALGAFVAITTILKIKRLSQSAYVCGISTRWLIMAIITGGVLLRIMYDTAVTVIGIRDGSYMPIIESHSFVSFWKESFTEIIPLSFLVFYSLNKALKDKADKTRNTYTVSKRIFYAYLSCFHLIAVGLLVETTSFSFATTSTFMLALLLTTNLSIIFFKFTPPLTYLCGRATIKGKSDE